MYKNQLEEVSSTVAMVLEHLTYMKQENLNLQGKSSKDQQDLEKNCQENEEYRQRHCLRYKNMKKKENETSKKVVEAVKFLISQMHSLIVHIVLAELMTLIVHFTTFRHCTMFYSEKKELKNGLKAHLNKIQIRPTDQSEKISKQYSQCRIHMC